MEVLKANFSGKLREWEEVSKTRDTNESELMRLEQMCQLGAQKNYELVDQNNFLLLKIFQLKLLIGKTLN